MFLRGLIGALIGAVLGAGAGALTLGFDASLDVGSSWIGPTSNWWPLAAMVGAVGGAIFGLGFGLFIVLSRVRPVGKLIVAGLIGGFGALVVLMMKGDEFSWLHRTLAARVAPLLLSLLLWPMIGLFMLIIANRLSRTN